MIKCPSCEHSNVDGTTFCEMCGEELQDAGSVASSPATSTIDTATGGDIKCPACENLNPPENVACEVCGTDLHAVDDEEDSIASIATPTTVDPLAPAADTTTAAASAPDNAPDTTSLIVADDSAATSVDSNNTTAPADTAAPPAAVPAVTPSTPSASGSLAPGQVKLTVEQGMTVGKQFVLGDVEMLVGREDEDEQIYPDIDLGDQDEGYVHRKHATLKFENGQLFVMHLGGANRSRINNKPIGDNEPQAVNIGDKIAFGKVVLRVHQA
jgi:hypothetical protein